MRHLSRLIVLAASAAVVLVAVAASPAQKADSATQGRWTIRDLGTMSGREDRACAINERGQIVGQSDGHAFLWENGTMRTSAR